MSSGPPSSPPSLRAEVVERLRAGQLAKPRALRAPAGVETLPAPERLLEGLPRQILSEDGIGGQKDEVAVDVVEMLLRHLRERAAKLRTARPGLGVAASVTD